MKPSRHAMVSFSLGLALWLFTKSISAALLCFASGVFVDIDHFIEYVIHHDHKTLSVKNVYKASLATCNQEKGYRFPKLFFVLHAGEIALLFWGLTVYTKNIYILAVALGYSSHLILDCIGNPLYISSYFMISRLIKGFDTDRLISKKGVEKWKRSMQ